MASQIYNLRAALGRSGWLLLSCSTCCCSCSEASTQRGIAGRQQANGKSEACCQQSRAARSASRKCAHLHVHERITPAGHQVRSIRVWSTMIVREVPACPGCHPTLPTCLKQTYTQKQMGAKMPVRRFCVHAAQPLHIVSQRTRADGIRQCLDFWSRSPSGPCRP